MRALSERTKISQRSGYHGRRIGHAVPFLEFFDRLVPRFIHRCACCPIFISGTGVFVLGHIELDPDPRTEPTEYHQQRPPLT
jgi:hypothetical protein